MASTAMAGSLLPQETGQFKKQDSNDLQLPTFAEGGQAGGLSFSAIGQAGTTQIYDLGGKGKPAVDGDIFQGLQQGLGGSETSLQGKSDTSE
ncbi:hypothetical protein [Hwanghaeella sp.]|uniref:hypothetical protein n=1 Tax=Hwanghaeella sp. TaxID=2605943 RepID=UPI003CCBD31F